MRASEDIKNRKREAAMKAKLQGTTLPQGQVTGNVTTSMGPLVPTPGQRAQSSKGTNFTSNASAARNTVSGQTAPSIASFQKPPIANAKTFDLAKAMAQIIDLAKGMVIRVEGGTGMSPEARRKLILMKVGISNEDFAFFAAVHLRRGSNWRLYTRQDNDLKLKYQAASVMFGISMVAGDKGVTSQVVACALGDLMIGARSVIPCDINGEKYNGSLHAKYQWVGSLATMYIANEDSLTDATEIQKAWITKTKDYCDWMAWYIGVTGAITGTDSTVQHESYDVHYRILKGAHYAWGGWDVGTRKRWAGDDFNFEPKSPGQSGRFAPLGEDFIDVIIDTWFPVVHT